jgi:hypothetical protein
MAWMGRRLAQFEPLWPAEQRVIDEMGSGAFVVVSRALPAKEAPQDVHLRASFVRYLALGGCEACRPPEKGIQVVGALIYGDGPEGTTTPGLDLERCQLSGDLVLLACFFPDKVLLRGAQLGALILDGSRLDDGLWGDRLKARGGVYLRRVDAQGEVRLVAAELGSNLECDGAVFRAKTSASGKVGPVFAADGLEAKGSVYLTKVEAIGEVRLLEATLGRDLGCIGACFNAEKDVDGHFGRAFSADRLDAKGTLFLRDVVWVDGVVSLTGAEVGSLTDERESWPAPDCLSSTAFGTVRLSTGRSTRIAA